LEEIPDLPDTEDPICDRILENHQYGRK